MAHISNLTGLPTWRGQAGLKRIRACSKTLNCNANLEIMVIVCWSVEPPWFQASWKFPGYAALQVLAYAHPTYYGMMVARFERQPGVVVV